MDSTWTRYMERRAPSGILCQFMRPGGEPWTGTNDFRPEFDIGNLYWRLTGIGRERLESMPLAARLQVECPSTLNGMAGIWPAWGMLGAISHGGLESYNPLPVYH